MAADNKLVMAIMAKKKKPSEKEDSEVEEGPSDDVETAAEELLAAVAAKDAKGVASALRSAFDIISSEE